ncbi:hypothetical protein [Nitrogeniibacter mangrovi]|nr:hypothetical protein [Nitrogeniibacter mangrovi]
MKRLLAALLTALFAFGSLSAAACTGDKAKDEKGGMSTPSGTKS